MKTMSWQDQLNGDSVGWLLEAENPGVRYLAMRDVLDLPGDDASLQEAQKKAHAQGPISIVLDAMDDEGFWEEPGAGYRPKYRSSVWSLILLAQLGASVELDDRIKKACRYNLEHALTDNGQFSANGTPSHTIDCLQGNLCTAMLDLGFQDPRLDNAYEWMARSVTGEGIAPMEDKKAPLRYYAGKCGPLFACGANKKLACAWGAVKVMQAFSRLPAEKRTPLIEEAIQAGVEFLLGIDPLDADYPSGWSDKPSRNWWKFGFPLFYVTDLLQNIEALIRLGYGRDPRLENALSFIREKQDDDGRWLLEYDYSGKTWFEFGPKKLANKWVTCRALYVLKNSYG
ncbi:nitrogen fixation protein NifH [Chloroflexota bacterium]